MAKILPLHTPPTQFLFSLFNERVQELMGNLSTMGKLWSRSLCQKYSTRSPLGACQNHKRASLVTGPCVLALYTRIPPDFLNHLMIFCCVEAEGCKTSLILMCLNIKGIWLDSGTLDIFCPPLLLEDSKPFHSVWTHYSHLLTSPVWKKFCFNAYLLMKLRKSLKWIYTFAEK